MNFENLTFFPTFTSAAMQRWPWSTVWFVRLPPRRTFTEAARRTASLFFFMHSPRGECKRTGPLEGLAETETIPIHGKRRTEAQRPEKQHDAVLFLQFLHEDRFKTRQGATGDSNDFSLLESFSGRHDIAVNHSRLDAINQCLAHLGGLQSEFHDVDDASRKI